MVIIDCGDVMCVCFVVFVNGIFISFKFVCIEGMESFEGDLFYILCWNYDILFEGKWVGIFGMGVMVV